MRQNLRHRSETLAQRVELVEQSLRECYARRIQIQINCSAVTARRSSVPLNSHSPRARALRLERGFFNPSRSHRPLNRAIRAATEAAQIGKWV